MKHVREDLITPVFMLSSMNTTSKRRRERHIFILSASPSLPFGRSVGRSRLHDNSSTMLIERNLGSLFKARGYERRITTGEKRYRAKENNLGSANRESAIILVTSNEFDGKKATSSPPPLPVEKRALTKTVLFVVD